MGYINFIHTMRNGFETVRDSVFSSSLFRNFNEAACGIYHLNSATTECKVKLSHDAGNFAIESGIALSEDFAPEAAAAVAFMQGGIDMAHATDHKPDLLHIGKETALSIVSSHAAALHAARNCYHDLVEIGQIWHETHFKY